MGGPWMDGDEGSGEKQERTVGNENETQEQRKLARNKTFEGCRESPSLSYGLGPLFSVSNELFFVFVMLVCIGRLDAWMDGRMGTDMGAKG